jgi:hypothetical protein
MKKLVAASAMTLGLSFAGVAVLEVPAFADCGVKCHGSWTWNEFTAETQTDTQGFVETICNCDGRRISSDSDLANGHKVIEYNNAANADGWVYMTYDQQNGPNSAWRLHRKEWGTGPGWQAWPIPCAPNCP